MLLVSRTDTVLIVREDIINIWCLFQTERTSEFYYWEYNNLDEWPDYQTALVNR